jgi:hypothetical protein
MRFLAEPSLLPHALEAIDLQQQIQRRERVLDEISPTVPVGPPISAQACSDAGDCIAGRRHYWTYLQPEYLTLLGHQIV